MNSATAPVKEETVPSAESREKPLATVGYHQAAILSWMEDIAPRDPHHG